MSREEAKDQKTLVLIKEFVTNSQNLRKLQDVPNEKTKYWVKRRLLKWRKNALHKKLRQDLKELTVRYEGILYQLLRQSGVDDGALKSTVTAIWISCQDLVLTLSDYKEFSTVLWSAYVSVTGKDIQSFRPKFMLRQLVDAMPSSDERGVLIYRAYDKTSANDLPGSEVLAKLKRAYAMLHQELLRHQSDLLVLTGKELSPVDVKSFAPPFVEYESWLFPA